MLRVLTINLSVTTVLFRMVAPLQAKYGVVAIQRWYSFAPFFLYRAMELCQELNLPSGVAHHEKCAGHMLLTEQEQAK